MVNTKEIRLRSIATLLGVGRHSDAMKRIEGYTAQMKDQEAGLGSIDRALEGYQKYTKASRRIIVQRALSETCLTAIVLDQRLEEAINPPTPPEKYEM